MDGRRRTGRWRWAAVAVAVLAVFVTPVGRAGAAPGGWTVMVFMYASDLEDGMIGNLEEMAQVGSNENVDIVVLLNRTGESSDAPAVNLPAFNGTKLLHVEQGQLVELADWSDRDINSPDTVAAFVADAAQRYPATHYGFVYSDHGGGWIGFGDNTHSWDLPQLAEGVRKGKEAAGFERYAMLGFDACLMGNWEVLTAMAPLTETYIGSAELEPGAGWDWTALSVLRESGTSAETLGRAVVDAYREKTTRNGDAASATLALFRADAVAGVTQAVNELAAASMPDPVGSGVALGRARAVVPSYGGDGTENSLIDLGALGAKLAGTPLEAQGARVAEAVGAAVVHQFAGDSFPGASGMSFFYPGSAEGFDAAKYTESVPAAGEWAGFLQQMFAVAQAEAGKGVVPGVTGPSPFAGEVQVERDGSEVTLSGTLPPDLAERAISARLLTGVLYPDGSLVVLEDSPAGFDPETGQVEGFFDGTLAQGEDEQATAQLYGSIDLDAEDVYGTYTLSFHYSGATSGPSGDPVVASWVVDLATGDLVAESWYRQDPVVGTFGPFFADPTGTLAPEFPVLAPDGTWSEVSDSARAFTAVPDEIDLDLVDVLPGWSYGSVLSVTFVGGTERASSATYVS